MANQHSTPVDLHGQEFGLLIVIRLVRTPPRKWECLCRCGKTTVVPTSRLTSGNTRSCGCKERMKHGLFRVPEYRIWVDMRSRCLSAEHRQYADYGGRGITVCARWLESFETFLADMGTRPAKHYSIDRKNNDGNYEPNNCRWATKKEQSRNTRFNRLITFSNQTHCLTEWAEILGINLNTLSGRLNRHKIPIERAFTMHGRLVPDLPKTPPVEETKPSE